MVTMGEINTAIYYVSLYTEKTNILFTLRKANWHTSQITLNGKPQVPRKFSGIN